ncbi:MAG: DUF3592 domain-containing protein [Planctomycetota bacterium]
MDSDIELFLFVLGAAVALSAFKVLSQTWKAAASRSWPSVTCEIVHSGVRSVAVDREHTAHNLRSEQVPHWVPDVRYEYSVGGRRYSGSTITFGKAGPFNDRRGPAERVAQRYPEGSTQRLFVDPARHEVSCLERAEGSMALGYAISGLLALTAVALAAVPAFA